MKHPKANVHDLQLFCKGMLLAFTDAKSLEATMVKDAGQLTDKQVNILVAQIKELLGYGASLYAVTRPRCLLMRSPNAAASVNRMRS